MKNLRNENCSFAFDGERISGDDFRDRHNEPRCYSISKRGLSKAWDTLSASFSPDTTMWSGMQILFNSKIKMRSYCAVD